MTLSPEDSRRFYDRVGRAQDSQAFYEDAAVDRMIALADLSDARSIFELGCGTGRLARRLLARHLPAEATYLAGDISPRMVQIAQARLSGWPGRARVAALEPTAHGLPGDTAGFDRFIATYVFDLLDDGDARRLLAEASRLLTPDGRLCLVSITPGPGGLPRLVSSAWAATAARFPRLVGGCKPTELRDVLDPALWTVVSTDVVTKWAVSSQVVVAVRAD